MIMISKTLPILNSTMMVLLLLNACVPARQFEEVSAAREKCQKELTELKARQETFLAKEKELNVRVEEMGKQIKNLSGDTLSLGLSLRRLTSSYDKLNSTYDLLLAKNEQLMRGKEEDNKRLMGQYQTTHDELIRKEDQLKLAEADLQKRQAEVDRLGADLKIFEKGLKEKEARVRDLESVLAKKDSTVKALKAKVSEALRGFQDNGLTVEMKNGKVYISLEERLLFESGSTVVDARGAEALKDLARVLEREKDIHVLIEGHTDNVPIKSANIKDNWDLSVLRATSIVRIITSGSKVDPRRLTAAGRGEYFPIDKSNSADSRKKNRRTEIILTPKLDELFSILDAQ
jgi:chemotaxis protein MotB